VGLVLRQPGTVRGKVIAAGHLETAQRTGNVPRHSPGLLIVRSGAEQRGLEIVAPQFGPCLRPLRIAPGLVKERTGCHCWRWGRHLAQRAANPRVSHRWGAQGRW
jgi:hypothetical protein